jgi:hypothetical protein
MPVFESSASDIYDPEQSDELFLWAQPMNRHQMAFPPSEFDPGPIPLFSFPRFPPGLDDPEFMDEMQVGATDFFDMASDPMTLLDPLLAMDPMMDLEPYDVDENTPLLPDTPRPHRLLWRHVRPHLVVDQ